MDNPTRFQIVTAGTLPQLVTNLNNQNGVITKVVFMGQIDDVNGLPQWTAVIDFAIPLVEPLEDFMYRMQTEDPTVEVTLEDKDAVSGGYKKTNSA